MGKNRHLRKAVVDFIVGGCFHGAVAASDADVVVVLDSLDELSRLPDLPNVIKVPVGDHETVLTLLERLQAACPEARALLAEYRQRPNVYLSSGMAQDPRLGACAVKDLALRGELAKVFDEVLVRLLEATNGQLSLIEVRELNSNAGGMGAGGAPELGALFLDYLEGRTNAQLRHVQVRVGGLSYARVAPRAFDNVRVTTDANVRAALGASRACRTRDLEFVELPLRDEDGMAIRDKRELRELLAGTLLQARLCWDVTGHLDAREVNHKSASPFGEMRRVSVCWSQFLDQGSLIRGAATYYRDRLKAFRTQHEPPDLGVANQVDVRLEPLEDCPLPAVDEVIQAIRRGEAAHTPLFDRFLNTGPRRFRPTVLFHTSPDHGVSLDQVLGVPGRPRNFHEVRAVVRRYRGVIAHLQRASRDAEEGAKVAQALFEKRRRRLASEIRRLRSFRRHVDILILSQKRVCRRAQITLEAFRKAHEQNSQAKARAAALAAALERVKSDFASYEDRWVRRIEQGLDKALENRALYLDTALFAPLEAVYSDLLDAVPRAGDAAAVDDCFLKPVLVRSVVRITLKGIGQMLGTDPTPQSILNALEDGERFPWKSPLWGGEPTPVEARHRFAVLPPVGTADMAELQKVAQERGLKAVLADAGTVAAGCCVVTFAFYPVTKQDEVMPPLYAPVEPSLLDGIEERPM